MQPNTAPHRTPTAATEVAATIAANPHGEAIKCQVREQFGRTAQAYVESAYHAHGPDLARLVALAEPRLTDCMLDISTGGGHTALALAPHVAQVIASDLTPPMLAAARTFLTSQGVANVAYVVADAEHLPFLEDSFDLVTVRMAPHHYADVCAATREMARVLRPDGRLVLIDSVAPEDPALGLYVNAIERQRDPSHVRCYTEREWCDFLSTAGLAISNAEQLRTTIDFAAWTARSGLPAEARVALEHDMLAASPTLRAYFAIAQREGRVDTWSCDLLVVRAIKPAE